MFLGEIDVRRRIATGSLGIDPLPDDTQLSSFAVDLRLGTEFLDLPLAKHAVLDPTRPDESVPTAGAFETVEIGNSRELMPGTTLMGTSREYVHFPTDLVGVLFPRSYLERVGLSVAAGPIYPGFEGKLTFTIRNTNTVPILIRPGQRIMRLCLAQLTQPSVVGYAGQPNQLRESSSNSVSASTEEGEIQALEANRQTAKVVTSSGTNRTLFECITRALSASGQGKGKLLEQAIADIFAGAGGLEIMRRNARLHAEEIDLVIKNNRVSGFWRVAGSPIVVECKNWSGKVGAREISVIVENLRALGPDSKAGILVAPNGITGDHHADAVLKIREARQQGRYVLVLGRKELEQLANGTSLDDIVEKKYDETILI